MHRRPFNFKIQCGQCTGKGAVGHHELLSCGPGCRGSSPRCARSMPNHCTQALMLDELRQAELRKRTPCLSDQAPVCLVMRNGRVHLRPSGSSPCHRAEGDIKVQPTKHASKHEHTCVHTERRPHSRTRMHARTTPTDAFMHGSTHPRTHAPTHPRTHSPAHPRTRAPTHSVGTERDDTIPDRCWERQLVLRSVADPPRCARLWPSLL